MTANASPQPRDRDYLQCLGASYPVRRDVCRSRQASGVYRQCRACPERGKQLCLFDSPLQIRRTAGADPPNRKR